jgi:hypothetical protein
VTHPEQVPNARRLKPLIARKLHALTAQDGVGRGFNSTYAEQVMQVKLGTRLSQYDPGKTAQIIEIIEIPECPDYSIRRGMSMPVLQPMRKRSSSSN